MELPEFAYALLGELNTAADPHDRRALTVETEPAHECSHGERSDGCDSKSEVFWLSVVANAGRQ